MTFTEIKTRIKDQCNLTSTEADTRVGKAINQYYRRITSQLGLEGSRFVTRSVSTTNGQQYVTFTDIEKIDRVIDATDSTAIRVLRPISIDEQRTTQPGTSEPTSWAVRNTDADSVVILLDTLPQVEYDLQADGTTTLSDLSGSDEPVFPESFHDILVYYVLAEELRRKEKVALAKEYANDADRLLSELRFHLADTQETVRQGERPGITNGGGAGGSGSATIGGTAYTQTALLTFDRGAGVAPFAVERSDAPYVANLGAEFLGNITTDRLIGRDTASTGESEQLTVGGGIEFTGSGGIQRSALTGDVTASAGSGATTIPNDTVTYAKMQNVSATDKVLGRSTAGSGDVEEIACTAAGRALIDDANAAAQRTTLGVGTGDSPTFTAVTLSNGQVAFPASQVSSADANTLDDYEEGSFTPIIGGTGGQSGQTYSVQVGRYVKIGRFVQAHGRVTLSAKGTITGSVMIGGLPFTVTNLTNGFSSGSISFWTDMTTAVVFLSCHAVANQTYATLTGATAAATDAVTFVAADVSDTTDFIFSVTYLATA